MPGVKSVNWTESNKAAALDALVAYSSVRISDEVAANIAKHVGGTCTSKAIHSFLAQSRRKFKPGPGAPVANGVATPRAVTKAAGTAPRATASRVTKNTPNSKPRRGAAGKKVKEEDSEDENYSEIEKEVGPATPPETPNPKKQKTQEDIKTMCSPTPQTPSTGRQASPIAEGSMDQDAVKGSVNAIDAIMAHEMVHIFGATPHDSPADAQPCTQGNDEDRAAKVEDSAD